jgi:peptide/nickel transport system permease protein/peptide/nickel transport system substrate-binding protein
MKRRTLLGAAAGIVATAGMARGQGTAPAPQKGGTLKLSAFGDITSFDPMTGRSGEDHMQLYPLYDTLVDYDFDSLAARPGLATAWNYTTPTTLVMDLRSGVTFHDGTPFDADAVKFNFDRNRTHPRSNIRADIAFVDSVDATSPTQVTLHLKQPDTALPLILADRAGMMVSPAAAKKFGDDFDRNPVGTGMMKFVEWRDKDRTVYTRNENYWKPNRPYLDGMRYALIAELQTGLRSVITGENDFIHGLLPQQLAVAKRAGSLTTLVTPTLACQLFFLNYGRGPLADVRVRQALNHAVDRSEYNKASALGLFELADMLLPKEHWAYDAALANMYPHDPAKARQLLADAGHPDGIELNMLTYSDQNSQQRAEILIEQLKAANVRIKLTSGSLPDITAAIFSKKEGDFLQSNWTGRPDPTLSYTLMFSKSGYFNPSGLETPGLEAALAASRATSDQAARTLAFAGVQKIVLDQALFVPLAFQSQIVAHTAKVQGYRPTLLGKPRFDDVFLVGGA